MSKHVHHTKLVVGIVLGVLMLIGLLWFIAQHRNGYETITLEPQELVRTITVTGEVVPVDEVTLRFSVGGRIASLFAADGLVIRRGDTLATLDASDVAADLEQSRADKAVAEAELAALVGSTVAPGRVAAVTQQAVTAISKAFSVAETQVTTQVDALFENPQSGRPQITPAIKDYFARQTIGQERVAIGKLLDMWRTTVAENAADTVTVNDVAGAYANLAQVRTFFSSISQALSDAETTNQVSETRLSEFRTIVTNARVAVDASLNELASSQETLTDVFAQNPVQRARVDSADASIARYEALLRNYTLTAPFDGTVAEVLVTTGETVAANQEVVSLISDGAAELEVYVPEVLVAHLDVGDQAVVTLDAFGADLRLGATVSFVDTRATQKNGIVTYRTKLSFNDVPTGVRPGMTATITIQTLVIPDVLVVPQAAVTVDDSSATVDVLVDGERQRRDVELGMPDTRGGVMVESGLEAGDKVITN